MTKFYWADLTKIACPFGMLDKDTQKRLSNCENVQWFNGNKWMDTVSVFDPEHTYRQKPGPKKVTVYLYRQTNGMIYATTHADSIRVAVGSAEIAIEEDEQ